MTRRLATTVAVLTAAVVALPGIAQANFAATGTGSPQVKARTISNASGLGSACVAQPGFDNVSLTWTASPDSAFVSYVINRTGGAGPFSFNAPVGSTSATDSSTTWAAAPGAFVYSYTIRAVVGTAPWTTTASAASTKNFSKSGKCT